MAPALLQSPEHMEHISGTQTFTGTCLCTSYDTNDISKTRQASTALLRVVWGRDGAGCSHLSGVEGWVGAGESMRTGVLGSCTRLGCTGGYGSTWGTSSSKAGRGGHVVKPSGGCCCWMRSRSGLLCLGLVCLGLCCCLWLGGARGGALFGGVLGQMR